MGESCGEELGGVGAGKTGRVGGCGKSGELGGCCG